MRYVPTVNDHSLKASLPVSIGLHLLLFFFVFFGLPRMVPPLPDHRGPIPFDIVTIGEITNTRVGGGSEEAGAPPPAVQPAPPKAEEAPAAPPPAPEAPPPPKAEAAPAVPPKAEEVVEPLKIKPLEKPKLPKEKKAPQPAQPDLLGSVLKNVAKIKPAARAVEANPKATEATGAANPHAAASSMAGAALTGIGTGTGPSLSSRLTITEEDALRRQIEQCWNPPVGARDAHNLIVEVIIDVNPDRTVLGAEIVDKFRYASNPFFRAAADAAIRAVRSPKCSPLELAPEKYEQWKRINFTFDPRGML